MHFHLWIGDYGPGSPEVKRALHALKNSQDVVSWSYSRCLPERPPVGTGRLLPLSPSPEFGVVDKAIAILEVSRDGLGLAEEDRKLLSQASAGNFDGPDAERAFNRLYEDVASGRYPIDHDWLFGFENLTRDGMGYVYWRGEHVEHFSHSSPEAMRAATEKLSLLCRYLEKQGRSVSGNYFAAWDEFGEFESAKKFMLTFPLKDGSSKDLRVHAYRRRDQLAEELKQYVPNWAEAPIKTAEELRALYCSDEVWEQAKHLDPCDDDDHARVAEQCACGTGVARAIIRAAISGKPQNTADRGHPEDWIRENYIRGKYHYDYVRCLEDAQEVIQRRSAGDSTRYSYCPDIAMAVRDLVARGELRSEIELMREFLAAAPAAKLPVSAVANRPLDSLSIEP